MSKQELSHVVMAKAKDLPKKLEWVREVLEKREKEMKSA